MGQNLAKRVKDLRKQKNWTQEELANRIGIARQNLQHLEMGRIRNPRYLLDLANALGTTTSWLLSEADAPPLHAKANPHEVVINTVIMKQIITKAEDFLQKNGETLGGDKRWTMYLSLYKRYYHGGDSLEIEQLQFEQDMPFMLDVLRGT